MSLISIQQCNGLISCCMFVLRVFRKFLKFVLGRFVDHLQVRAVTICALGLTLFFVVSSVVTFVVFVRRLLFGSLDLLLRRPITARISMIEPSPLPIAVRAALTPITFQRAVPTPQLLRQLFYPFLAFNFVRKVAFGLKLKCGSEHEMSYSCGALNPAPKDRML